MIDPRRWTADQLADHRLSSIQVFRTDRLAEPAEVYPDALDRCLSRMEEFIEGTVDLRKMSVSDLLELVTNADGMHAFRYLASPPISEDDLKQLAAVKSLAPRRLREDPELIGSLSHVIVSCIDRRRFPWLVDNREPTEEERNAAIFASATLMACQRVQTDRRNLAKTNQENLIATTLMECSFEETERRDIETITDAPAAGKYCREVKCVTKRADLVVGLWDKRTLLIECKVSNSEVNSFKRLNLETVGKANVWNSYLGTSNVVPAAVLSGVFKKENLEEAQRQGVTLFWAHDLTSLRIWLDAIRQEVTP